jgi:hypothetical protein
MSTAGPLGGSVGGLGAPTINAKASTVPPWEVVPEVRERPASTQKMSTAAPWEAVLEDKERPPSMQKMSIAAPLGGGAGGPEVATINAKNVNGGPP